jgi:hypothetical protein
VINELSDGTIERASIDAMDTHFAVLPLGTFEIFPPLKFKE